MTRFEQLQKENEKLKTKNRTQKKLTEYAKEATTEQIVSTIEEFEKQYISKDVLRKKIKELKGDEEKLKQDEDYVPIYQIKSKIKVLNELLRGE